MKKNPQEGVPDYLYDRAATEEEKKEVQRIQAEHNRTEGRVADLEAILPQLQSEEIKWLHYLEFPDDYSDLKRDFDSGKLKMKVIKGGGGKYVRVEIRDDKNNLIFYSTQEEFNDAWLRSMRGKHYSDERGFPVS